MTLRRSSTARQDSDVPTTHAGDQTTAEVTGDPPASAGLATNPPGPHPAPAPGGAGRARRRTRRAGGGAPQRPDATAPEVPDTSASEVPDTTAPEIPDTTAPEVPESTPDSLTPVQKIMHARLAAMSAPRDSDDPETARLRGLLRDWEVMAEVTATVDGWQPVTDEQRATLAALLYPHQTRRRGAAG